MEPPKPTSHLVLRIIAVSVMVSAMAGYALYSQYYANHRVARSTKSTTVLEDPREIDPAIDRYALERQHAGGAAVNGDQTRPITMASGSKSISGPIFSVPRVPYAPAPTQVVEFEGSINYGSPTPSDTRNTGVTLEVEPTIGPDGASIDLQLAPQVVEFEGFINYGSPITAQSNSGAAANRPTMAVSSKVLVPIFSTRAVTPAEKEKLPAANPPPAALAPPKAAPPQNPPPAPAPPKKTTYMAPSSKLTILVHARIVDPDGKPIISDEEEEEKVEEIPLPEIAPANAAPAIFDKAIVTIPGLIREDGAPPKPQVMDPSSMLKLIFFKATILGAIDDSAGEEIVESLSLPKVASPVAAPQPPAPKAK